MSVKRRVNRLLAKRGGQCKNEPRITLMQDGREVTVLDLSGTGITWSQLFESIARRGTIITDAARHNHV
jgi:hypothetical protein